MMENNKMETFGYQYYNKGRAISQSEFEKICLVPLVGVQRSKRCLTVIKYQLFCLCENPSRVSVIVHKEQTSQREYIYLTDFRLQVFFRIFENICHIDEVAR